MLADELSEKTWFNFFFYLYVVLFKMNKIQWYFWTLPKLKFLFSKTTNFFQCIAIFVALLFFYIDYFWHNVGLILFCSLCHFRVFGVKNTFYGFHTCPFSFSSWDTHIHKSFPYRLSKKIFDVFVLWPILCRMDKILIQMIFQIWNIFNAKSCKKDWQPRN